MKEISKTNLSHQQVSSLMIVSGNLIVGRYQHNFIRQFDDTRGNNGTPFREILAAVIPWLSSTQGFSRAIAQLLGKNRQRVGGEHGTW